MFTIDLTLGIMQVKLSCLYVVVALAIISYCFIRKVKLTKQDVYKIY